MRVIKATNPKREIQYSLNKENNHDLRFIVIYVNNATSGITTGFTFNEDCELFLLPTSPPSDVPRACNEFIYIVEEMFPHGLLQSGTAIYERDVAVGYKFEFLKEDDVFNSLWKLLERHGA